jgi:hypothetical protein
METSTLPYRPLFVVGLPRSGTTLVQAALSSYPSTVTTRETHLFDFYLWPLMERFFRETEFTKSEDGIRHLLSNDAFLSMMRGFAVTVLDAIHSKKPTASVVIEKTPDHLFLLPAICRCLPEVHILHVIRDPRGVIASLKAAAREEWGSWAAVRTLPGWATYWRDGIDAGRRCRAAGFAYREIRYEDLFVSAGSVMNEILEWLGLPADRTLPSDLRVRFPVGDMVRTDVERHHPQQERRPNFFRRGDPDRWREELAKTEIEEIENICRSAMAELGYHQSDPR